MKLLNLNDEHYAKLLALQRQSATRAGYTQCLLSKQHINPFDDTNLPEGNTEHFKGNAVTRGLSVL